MTASAVQTISERKSGNTATLVRASRRRNLLHHVAAASASALRIPRRTAVLALSAYQATLSPDHGPLRHLFPHGYCCHEPTCSAYGKTVIAERGVIVGGWLLLRRLATCHPWKKPDAKKIMAASYQRTR